VTPRVVLVNPPGLPGTTANREGAAGLGQVEPVAAGFTYPPQTLAAVAAGLRQVGWPVAALDAVGEGLDLAATLGRLQASGADAVGVQVSWATAPADVAFLRAWRAAAPDIPVVLFGPAVRYLGAELLPELGSGAALAGEPEGAFPVACQAALGSPGRAQLLTPAGLGAANYDEQGFLVDLDALPSPAWDLLPRERYRFLTLMGSRGCGDQCAYCPYVAAQGMRFRGRSPEGIVNELAWLGERFRPPRIVFRDPVFAWDPARVYAICEGILRRGLRASWECESRPEHFDPEMLALMKRAGCEGIKIGVETIAEPLLHRVRRLDQEQEAEDYRAHVAELVRASKELGLRCRLFVMLGLPGESEADLQATADWAESLAPSALNIKPLEKYPGIRMSPEEQDQAQPPSERWLSAFEEIKRRCEAPGAAKPGWGQRAQGWLRRRLRGGER